MITAQKIAILVDGKLIGPADKKISSLQTLELAGPESVSFIADKKYLSKLDSCHADLLLIREEFSDQYSGDCIIVEDPYLAFSLVSHLFDTEPKAAGDIHVTAVIHDSATIGNNVSIAANAVIGAKVVLEAGCSVGANSIIGEECYIGMNTVIYPNVTLYHQVMVGNNCRIHSGSVVGCHGFGYANSKGNWHKIAQIGKVIIGDDVEIGANCTIDRGAIEDTVIQKGVKLDNLVHIAHNVVIGEHSALAAQVGIAGSTVIGHHTMAGGQSGFSGHLETAPGCVFTGQAMISGSISEKGSYSSGTGNMASKDWRKMAVRLRYLDDMAKQIKRLEKQINSLQGPSE